MVQAMTTMWGGVVMPGKAFVGGSAQSGHASTTDPEVRRFRESNDPLTHLFYIGTALMENRHSLAVASHMTVDSGAAECLSAFDLADKQIS